MLCCVGVLIMYQCQFMKLPIDRNSDKSNSVSEQEDQNTSDPVDSEESN